MPWKPTKDRIIIKRDPADETSAGGVIIPSIAKKKPTTGVVVAIGPNVSDAIAVDDRLMFDKYAGDIIDTTRDGVQTILLRESEVMALVTP